MAELVHSESTKEVMEEATSTVARVPFPQDIRGKLAVAKAYKDEGNEHFKKGDFKKAKSCYGKVLAFTRGLPGSTRGMEGMVEMAAKNSSGVDSTVTIEEDQQAVELEVIAQTNMATCFLKLDKPREALEKARLALNLNNRYWKALLRKGEALLAMKDCDNAQIAFDEALEHCDDPNGRKTIENQKRELKKAQKEEGKKQQAFAANMFRNRTSQPAASSDSPEIATLPESLSQSQSES